ncbi:Detected protein of confused Function [Hibiscus syriacus]|uniref:Detected protein of confused Function n=1 Tax=Hibiscus syriacus TaxID=106335 RepID=A0A6A2WJM0_HIBSY|nr:Detected protein of confused Function [Hibiscus syriacus]
MGIRNARRSSMQGMLGNSSSPLAHATDIISHFSIQTAAAKYLIPKLSLSFIKTQPPRSLHGGLPLLSSVLSTGFVEALSYEEALQQTTGSPSSLEVDPSWILYSVLDFAAENPTVVAGGVVVLAIPLILSQLLKNPKPWGVESAKNVALATTTFSAHPSDFPRPDPHVELPHAIAATLSQITNASGAVSVSQQS